MSGHNRAANGTKAERSTSLQAVWSVFPDIVAHGFSKRRRGDQIMFPEGAGSDMADVLRALA
ncbi:MAG: hypothetical protein ABI999_02755 [Acidobacteriota bacterium]